MAALNFISAPVREGNGTDSNDRCQPDQLDALSIRNHTVFRGIADKIELIFQVVPGIN